MTYGGILPSQNFWTNTRASSIRRTAAPRTPPPPRGRPRSPVLTCARFLQGSPMDREAQLRPNRDGHPAIMAKDNSYRRNPVLNGPITVRVFHPSSHYTCGALTQSGRIHMFDVGGQRSERKKLIYCFEGVTSIIFCTIGRT